MIQIQISRLAFIIYFWHLNRWCHTPIAFPERWHDRLSINEGGLVRKGACVNLANEFNIADDDKLLQSYYNPECILRAYWKGEYIYHSHLRSFWTSVPNTSNHLFVCSAASFINMMWMMSHPNKNCPLRCHSHSHCQLQWKKCFRTTSTSNTLDIIIRLVIHGKGEQKLGSCHEGWVLIY